MASFSMSSTMSVAVRDTHAGARLQYGRHLLAMPLPFEYILAMAFLINKDLENKLAALWRTSCVPELTWVSLSCFFNNNKSPHNPHHLPVILLNFRISSN